MYVAIALKTKILIFVTNILLKIKILRKINLLIYVSFCINLYFVSVLKLWYNIFVTKVINLTSPNFF